MYTLIESLLLNFLFLLFPIVVFLIFFENTLRSYHKFVFSILSSVTMILCMTFPIKLEVGFIFDLRLHTFYPYCAFRWIQNGLSTLFGFKCISVYHRWKWHDSILTVLNRDFSDDPFIS